MPASPAFMPVSGVPAAFRLADWMGIPFRPHGRDLQGCDCYGLVCLFYRSVFALDLPPYNRPVTDVHDMRAVGRAMTPVANGPLWQRTCTPRFGDVIAFGTPTLIYHVGLYLAPGEMLHTRAGTDSTPERYGTPLWDRRHQGFFRYKDFVNG